METIEEKAKRICDRLACHEIFPDEVACLREEWATDSRWNGIARPYSPRKY